MECVLRASWIWGVGGVYDTTPDRQAIGWIGSQFWGICSEGALRKTGDHVQYVFILTCGLRSACFFCLFVFGWFGVRGHVHPTELGGAKNHGSIFCCCCFKENPCWFS